jgi:DNA replication and repair protein RecF
LRARGALNLTISPIHAVLSDLTIENFRCIERVDLSFDPSVNVFVGGNGSGKTSILEAIFMLGRARSFRSADNRVVIRSGQAAAILSGQVFANSGLAHVGLQVAAAGTEVRISGHPEATGVDLAELLPVQAIHSSVGELIQGAPEARRRLLDWGVFHVKHGYLEDWRQFRRALAQRNASLRKGEADEVIKAWEQELVAAALKVDEKRREYVEGLAGTVGDFGQQLLGLTATARYQQGWPAGESLRDALKNGRGADRMAGFTRYGPHRADLHLETDTRSSRWRSSRGQQKLLGAALVLAQCQTVTARLNRPIVLLVDEPAADLDSDRLGQLMRALGTIPAQLFIATIGTDRLPLPATTKMFHVEHGEAKALL